MFNSKFSISFDFRHPFFKEENSFSGVYKMNIFKPFLLSSQMEKNDISVARLLEIIFLKRCRDKHQNIKKNDRPI